jgi:ATP-dependent DNA helicase RecG
MTTVDELEDWMTRNEDEHLEFKAATGGYEFEQLVDYAVALANERGGRFILGVSDKKPRRVVGTAAFPEIERTKAGLMDRIHLRVEVDEVRHPGGRVLVFQIPSRPIGTPVHDRGQYFMRSGEQLVPMLPDMLRRIFDEAGPDFSAEFCPRATFADLDRAAIADFRHRWARKGGGREISDGSDEDVLSGAELIEGTRVTYAALILFGLRASLGRLLPQAEVIFEYRSGDGTGAAQVREEYRQGFFSFYEDLWTQINLRNDTQHFQDGLFLLDIKTFNEKAIREAVLNAVSHRDYRMAGSVFVRQYPRRLEIVNPGPAPGGISFENILWQQAPRNRRIAETLARCGLVERSGQGMNTIFETCIRESKPYPDFGLSDDYHFGMTLEGQIRHPEFLRVLEMIGQEQMDLFSTSDFLVVDRVYEGGEIPERLTNSLHRLLDSGIVERSNQNKAARYVLSRRFYHAVGEHGVYTRKKGLDRETNKALLLKHIQESAGLGSRLEVLRQVLPALDPKTVQNLLSDLAKDGQIHVVGRTKAGRWFPGPHAPNADLT